MSYLRIWCQQQVSLIRHEQVIKPHKLLQVEITYPCLRYQLQAKVCIYLTRVNIIVADVLVTLGARASTATVNHIDLVIPWYSCFTTGLWAHNPSLEKIHIALAWKIMFWSGHNFAHVTAAAVTCAKLRPDYDINNHNSKDIYFLQDFNYELINPLWNGS